MYKSRLVCCSGFYELQCHARMQADDTDVYSSQLIAKIEGAPAGYMESEQSVCAGSTGADSEGMLSDTDYGSVCMDVRPSLGHEPDFAFVSPDKQNDCVQEIMAFVRGDSVGLMRLKQVLSNIFAFFPECDQQVVLERCGLHPYQRPDGKMSFVFDPPQDNVRVSRKRPALSADQLDDAYEQVSSTWSSSSRRRASNS